MRSKVHQASCRSCQQGLPHVGERCPRCHKPAPRMDGIKCALCAPGGLEGVTLTDPKTGITHAYRNGCVEEIDLASLKLKHFNVGKVDVTCLECLAHKVAPREWGNGPKEMIEYAKEDAERTMALGRALSALNVEPV